MSRPEPNPIGASEENLAGEAMSSKAGSTAGKLTSEVRQFLSQRLISRVVASIGMKEIFLKSWSWPGYERACEGWHNAYWKWIDHQIPAKNWAALNAARVTWSKTSVAEAIRAAGVDPSKLPGAEEGKKQWLDEFFRHDYAQQITGFNMVMRGQDSRDPEIYKSFLPDMKVASNIGIDTHFEALARQQQRKPTKDKGDRLLKPQMLVYWIAGCLWAFTTDGVAQFLNAHHPRAGNRLYDNKTISDARRDLRLYKPRKPLWWGLAGTPAHLVPLR